MSSAEIRMLNLGCLVAMHVAAIVLVVYVLELPDPNQPWRWPAFTVATLLSLFADWLFEHVPRRWRRTLWVIAGCVVIVLLTKQLLGGGLDPRAGWNVLVSENRDIQSIVANLGGLLFLWGRGARLPLFNQQRIAVFFQRTVVGLLLFIALHAIITWSAIEAEALTYLAGNVVIFITSGLLALSLANVTSSTDSTLQRRWAISTLVPVMAVVVVGVAMAALFMSELRHVLLMAIQALLIGVGFLIWPFALLLSPLVAIARDALRAMGVTEWLPSADDVSSELPSTTPVPEAVAGWDMPWLEAVARFAVLLLLIGVVVLVLRWLGQRVRRPATQNDDHRISVWSWQAFGDDLRGMLHALLDRGEQQTGLLATLHALRSRDPVSRVRRAYVRLLILAEEHEHGRAPHQTPREYEPAVEDLAPDARSSVANLTDLYEQARYGALLSEAQAVEAETALRTIEKNAGK